MAKYRYYISLMFILSALAVFSFSHVSYSPRSVNAAQPAHEYNRQELTKASDYILPLKGVNEQLLRRKGYLASYNRYTKEPNWVAWHLTKEHLSERSSVPVTHGMKIHRFPLPGLLMQTTRKAVGQEDTCVLQVITNGTEMPCTTHFSIRMSAPNIPG